MTWLAKPLGYLSAVLPQGVGVALLPGYLLVIPGLMIFSILSDSRCRCFVDPI
jgi:hypothetical protein